MNIIGRSNMLITSGSQRIIEGFPSLFLIFACYRKTLLFQRNHKTLHWWLDLFFKGNQVCCILV